jgi:hypothetical protein
MPTIIETVDGGEISTGFLGRDLSKVQLGELPLMTIQQFAHYAAAVLVKGVFPKLDSETRTDWAEDVHHIARRIGALSLRRTNGITKEEMGKPFETLAAAEKEAEFYEDNPFVVQEDGRSVSFKEPGDGVKHVITSEDFFGLTYEVVNGGIIGWGASGTYPEVKDAVALLDSALSTQ